MAESERAPDARPRRLRSGFAAKPPPRPRKQLILAAVGAVVLIGGFVTYYKLVLSDSARHHEFAIDWPVPAPRGDPIEIGHEWKAGDVFLTKYGSRFQIVLTVDNNVSLNIGMNLEVGLIVGHGIKASPPDSPPGLVSTRRTAVTDARSTPPEWAAPVWTTLNNRAVPCEYVEPLDPTGKSIGPVVGGPLDEEQRKVLDGVLCGLGDLTTNYLPPRPIRLGDVWKLSDAVDLPGIMMVVRKVARSDEYPSGYPEIKIDGRVAAEALEPRDGEPCLRLRLVVYVTQEGDAVAPALPGRISTAAKIDGHIWISTAKGAFWEQDIASEIMTSYLSVRPTERHATARLTAKTARGEHMPGE